MTARWMMVAALAALLVGPGCDKSGPGKAQPTAQGGDAAPEPVEGGTPVPAKPEQPGVPEGQDIAEFGPAERSFRFSVEATLSDLPAGARVIAPSAKDRRFQKVTKSEHTGAPGSVFSSEDGENLLYISEPVAADAVVTYKGVFEVTARLSFHGSVLATQDVAYDKAQVVTGQSTDAALVKVAAGLAPADAKPYTSLWAALDSVMGGSMDNAAAASAALADLLKLRGIPATLAYGLLAPGDAGTVDVGHAWVLATLPEVGPVPIDVFARKVNKGDAKKNDETYVGVLPADRITFITSDSVVIPAEGDVPKLTLSGDLSTPFAVHEGKRVGKVSFKATVEKIAPPAKK